jgi:hypothetical protein
MPNGILLSAVCRFTGEPTPVTAANFTIYHETHRKRSWIVDRVRHNAGQSGPRIPERYFYLCTKGPERADRVSQAQ